MYWNTLIGNWKGGLLNVDKIIKNTSWSNMSYSDVQRELAALRASEKYYKNPMSQKQAFEQMEEDRSY